MDDATKARIIAAGRGKLRMDFIHPPIPIRSMDWQAVFDNDEPDDEGHMLVGRGATAAEAIEDLLTTWEER